MSASGFDDAFIQCSELYARLRAECQKLLEPIARERDGFFVDRLKERESVFSKVESGQHGKPFEEIVDFYGATIAVPTIRDVDWVATEVLTDFVELSRRTSRGNNEPREFIYDDLHLILQLKDTNMLADKTLLGLSFELQVKSMLQFAWTKVTHDTVYKGDDVSWASDRFAAEAKAALELLDNLFTNVPTTSSLHIAKDNEDYIAKKAMLDLLKEGWSPDLLPTDLRRAAFTVNDFRILAGWSVDQTKAEVSAEATKDLRNAASLTAVQSFLAIIFNSLDASGRQLLMRNAREQGRRFHITEEMEGLAPVVREIPPDLRVEF